LYNIAFLHHIVVWLARWRLLLRAAISRICDTALCVARLLLRRYYIIYPYRRTFWVRLRDAFSGFLRNSVLLVSLQVVVLVCICHGAFAHGTPLRTPALTHRRAAPATLARGARTVNISLLCRCGALMGRLARQLPWRDANASRPHDAPWRGDSIISFCYHHWMRQATLCLVCAVACCLWLPARAKAWHFFTVRHGDSVVRWEKPLRCAAWR